MGVFRFKQFSVDDSGCGMKICSDSVLLGAWFLPSHSHAASVLDIGAGSGLLALMAVQVCPEASVTGIEIDPKAAAAARANFAASPFASRLTVTEGDFNTITLPLYNDIVISNPPYFTTGERSADTARSTARHQASLSYEAIFSKPDLIKPDGHIGLVSPAEFEKDIIFHAEMGGLKLRRMLRVCTATTRPASRLLWDFSRTDGPVTEEILKLRNSAGELTEGYRRMVDAFYVKL